VKKGHYDVVNLLLQNDANINLQDNEGLSPLMLASTNGHLDIVKTLLIMGANKDLQNNDGQTALQLALANNNEEIAYLLRNWNRTMAAAALQKLGVLSGVDPSLIKKDLNEYIGSGGRKRIKKKSKKNKRKSSKNKRRSSKKRK